MPYIGAPLISTNFVLDQFTATAGQTAFTLTQSPASVQSVLVIIDGIVQEPGVAYTLSGTALTMSSGVPLNAKVYAIHLGVRGTTTAPADGSVVTASLSGAINLSAFMPTGSIVQSVYAEYTAQSVMSVAIPVDNTIPQNTEGTQILSATITPKSTSNKIRVRFMGQYGVAGAAQPVSAALFKDSAANAICATYVVAENTAQWSDQIVLSHEDSPASVSAITYKLRVGCASGNMWINADGAGSPVFGGTSRATLVVEEIKG